MGLTKVTYAMIEGDYLNVNDYGADPTGVDDSTTAIQSAIDAALANGQCVTAIGTYKISSKIVIKGDANFSQATFNVYSTPTIAVEVSTGNASDPTTELSKCVIWLPKRINNMTKPATGWAGQGIGVRTVSVFDCQIFVGAIVDFAIGLQLTSFNTNGNVNNNYYLGALQNNKINLDLTPGDSTSWTNENIFIGGHLSHYSSEGTGVSGTRHIRISKATLSSNNNVFLKPDLEGDTPEYHVENGGSNNTIQQARWESTTPKVLYTYNNSNQASDNLIIGGYGVNQIQFTFTGTGGGNYNKVLGGRSNNYDSGTSTTGIYKMMNAGSSSDPIHTFYEASNTYRPESAGSTDWAVRHSAETLSGKRRTDAYARITVDYVNGLVAVGDGTAAPTNGAFGTFTSADGKTITVRGGIVKSIV